MEQIKSLNKDIEEYYRFKTQRDQLNKRLEELNERIKKKLIYLNSGQANENVNYFGADNFKVELQVKKKHRVDELALDNLFTERDLYDSYAETYIPEHAIEEAYLHGDLTDKDLRDLQKTDYSLALHVVKRVESNV